MVALPSKSQIRASRRFSYNKQAKPEYFKFPISYSGNPFGLISHNGQLPLASSKIWGFYRLSNLRLLFIHWKEGRQWSTDSVDNCDQMPSFFGTFWWNHAVLVAPSRFLLRASGSNFKERSQTQQLDLLCAKHHHLGCNKAQIDQFSRRFFHSWRSHIKSRNHPPSPCLPITCYLLP